MEAILYNLQSTGLEKIVVIFRPSFLFHFRRKSILGFCETATLIDSCELLDSIVMESERL